MKKTHEDGLSIHIIDLLRPWAMVESRRMFGGYGLYARSRMFALIFDDTLYLKDSFDEQGEPVKTPFEKEYFEYSRNGEIARLRYFKAPLSALENGSFLAELAETSWRSASAAAKLKPTNKKKAAVAKPKEDKKAPTAKSKPGADKTKSNKKPRTKPPASILNSPHLF